MRRLDLNPTRPAGKKREPLLAIPDAAEILNVSVKQVRRYINDPDPRKRLPVIRIGRLVRIDPADLENFIRDRRWG
jgi:excisionase family DNA binding protein